ncbi:hypothetical protein ACSHWG_01010 [Leucobacter sp. Z1108]|uniref:hypothetical protein n=1 Tax=Leucobacter sp. Z1108 TaxID=3439066 RepID=UPI003F3DF8E1
MTNQTPESVIAEVRHRRAYSVYGDGTAYLDIGRLLQALELVMAERDAATETIEAQLVNAKAGWDSALRIVNSGNEIIKQVGAERDAANAAIAAARVVCLQLGGVDGDVSQPAPSYYVSVGRNVVATEVLAALDGAPEPEWEGRTIYGSQLETGHITIEPRGLNYATHQRTAKFGPWLPVVGEKP